MSEQTKIISACRDVLLICAKESPSAFMVGVIRGFDAATRPKVHPVFSTIIPFPTERAA